jgi:RNA polymerase sigma-70 factor (ECF subfamily)
MRSAPGEEPTAVVIAEDGPSAVTAEQQESFGRLYEILFPQLCDFAALYVDPDRADDAVHDAISKVWSRRPDIALGNPSVAFFFRAVRNQVATSRMREMRERLRLGFFLRHVKLRPHRRDRPDLKADQAEFRAIVKAALAAMPERCREVWKLVRDHQLTYEEAAAVLDITPSTARCHLHRAKRLMQQALRDAGYMNATALEPPPVPKLLPARTAEEGKND